MNYIVKVLKNYANFEGRARRSEYWYFFLFNFVVSFVLGFIGGMIGSSILSGIFALGVLIPGIAVAIRRMHDVGKSGWYCLIPIYNIILCCTEGDRGPNQYGEDPKNEENTVQGNPFSTNM